MPWLLLLLIGNRQLGDCAHTCASLTRTHTLTTLAHTLAHTHTESFYIKRSQTCVASENMLCIFQLLSTRCSLASRICICILVCVSVSFRSLGARSALWPGVICIVAAAAAARLPRQQRDSLMTCVNVRRICCTAFLLLFLLLLLLSFLPVHCALTVNPADKMASLK